MSARPSSTCRCCAPAWTRASPISTRRSTRSRRRSREDPAGISNYEWKRAAECEEKGITAILGAGFDPGVVNAYAKLAKDEYLDKVTDVDIVDINAGSHSEYFATNFDPEISFREFTGVVYSWQNGQWQTNKMFEIGKEYDLPIVGKRKAYLRP